MAGVGFQRVPSVAVAAAVAETGFAGVEGVVDRSPQMSEMIAAGEGAEKGARGRGGSREEEEEVRIEAE